ncbi:MAG: hypothetical protein KUG77_05775 [Nannocystaceae bacterium]|nr:hypothetical protein [Nannocystaceae bacterium]
MVLACVGCDENTDDTPLEMAGGEASTGHDGGRQDEPPAAEAACEGEGACGGYNLCDVYDCGGRPARYNHFGCERVPCDADEDCPSGEACFSLAFDRNCEASSTVCFEEGNACVCEASDDCDGVLDAHCLPTEFYPPADYCDPKAWPCDELDAWRDALLRAAQEHAGTPLSEALTDCATEATEAHETCR